MTQKQAVVLVLGTIVEAIREAGAAGVPSGHLYAMLMPLGLSLDTYQTIIGAMVKSGQVTDNGHLLKIVQRS